MTFVSLVLLLSSLALAADAADCDRWQESYLRYEHEIYEAIRDEPEDLPKELRRYAKASRNGDVAQAERIDNKIRGGLAGLREIRPHPGMARFHKDMIEYYTHGVSVLDAVQRGDERSRSLAEIRTWQSLRAFFVTMRRLLIDHDCDEGDIDTIDRKYLPHIDSQIRELTGARGSTN